MINNIFKFQVLLSNHIPNNYKRYSSEGPYKKPKESAKGIGPVSWKNLGITAVVGSGLLAFMWYLKKEKEDGIN